MTISTSGNIATDELYIGIVIAFAVGMALLIAGIVLAIVDHRRKKNAKDEM